MPIYEYRCKRCNGEFEKLIFRSDDTDIICPDCQSHEIEKKMSAASVLAGNQPAQSGCASAPSSGFG